MNEETHLEAKERQAASYADLLELAERAGIDPPGTPEKRRWARQEFAFQTVGGDLNLEDLQECFEAWVMVERPVTRGLRLDSFLARDLKEWVYLDPANQPLEPGELAYLVGAWNEHCPSAPATVAIRHDPGYRKALFQSDFLQCVADVACEAERLRNAGKGFINLGWVLKKQPGHARFNWERLLVGDFRPL